MYTQNNKVINADTGFYEGTVWRPFKLLEGLSDEQKAELNIKSLSQLRRTVRRPRPPLKLETVVEKKLKEMNSRRGLADNGSFTFQGKTVDGDSESRSKMEAITGLITLMGGQLPPGWVGGWKANDNTIIPIPDVETWVQFFGSMVAQGQANFVRSETRKGQVKAIVDSDLTDEEKLTQVQAVRWETQEEVETMEAEILAEMEAQAEAQAIIDEENRVRAEAAMAEMEAQSNTGLVT
jgi:hypothetical protein